MSDVSNDCDIDCDIDCHDMDRDCAYDDDSEFTRCDADCEHQVDDAAAAATACVATPKPPARNDTAKIDDTRIPERQVYILTQLFVETADISQGIRTIDVFPDTSYLDVLIKMSQFSGIENIANIRLVQNGKILHLSNENETSIFKKAKEKQRLQREEMKQDLAQNDKDKKISKTDIIYVEHKDEESRHLHDEIIFIKDIILNRQYSVNVNSNWSIIDVKHEFSYQWSNICKNWKDLVDENKDDQDYSKYMNMDPKFNDANNIHFIFNGQYLTDYTTLKNCQRNGIICNTNPILLISKHNGGNILKFASRIRNAPSTNDHLNGNLSDCANDEKEEKSSVNSNNSSSTTSFLSSLMNSNWNDTSRPLRTRVLRNFEARLLDAVSSSSQEDLRSDIRSASSKVRKMSKVINGNDDREAGLTALYLFTTNTLYREFGRDLRKAGQVNTTLNEKQKLLDKWQDYLYYLNIGLLTLL